MRTSSTTGAQSMIYKIFFEMSRQYINFTQRGSYQNCRSVLNHGFSLIFHCDIVLLTSFIYNLSYSHFPSLYFAHFAHADVFVWVQVDDREDRRHLQAVGALLHDVRRLHQSVRLCDQTRRPAVCQGALSAHAVARHRRPATSDGRSLHTDTHARTHSAPASIRAPLEEYVFAFAFALLPSHSHCFPVLYRLALSTNLRSRWPYILLTFSIQPIWKDCRKINQIGKIRMVLQFLL